MVNWHKFFTSILDTISDGVFISDAVGTTLYVNQMYADLVGVPARELRGKNVRDLVSEGLFDLALNPEVVRTGKPATYMQKLKDGKNVVISGAPVFDDKGRVCLVVTFVRDETWPSSTSRPANSAGSSRRSTTSWPSWPSPRGGTWNPSLPAAPCSRWPWSSSVTPAPMPRCSSWARPAWARTCSPA